MTRTIVVLVAVAATLTVASASAATKPPRVGQKCAAKHEAVYRRAGLTCKLGHLKRRAKASDEKPYVPAPTYVSPDPKPGERGNPFPLGHTINFGTTWAITVIAVEPDATATVLARNRFNRPPASGKQFFMVTIRETYLGPGSARFDAGLHLRVVGQSNIAYTTYDNGCGVLPGRDLTTDEPELFTGGTIEGNECWSVASSDVASLLMFVNTTPPTFFALR